MTRLPASCIGTPGSTESRPPVPRSVVYSGPPARSHAGCKPTLQFSSPPVLRSSSPAVLQSCCPAVLFLLLLCSLLHASAPSGRVRADYAPSEWPTFHADNGRTGVSALDFTGPPFAHLWTFDLGQHTWKYCQGASVWSACALIVKIDEQMRVIAGAYDHNIYCLDARTGLEVWRFTTGCLVNAAPTFAVIDGRPTIFAASADRTFYALDARTGTKIWNLETFAWTYTIGESVAGAPLIAEVNGAPVLFATMWNGDRRPLRTVQTGELFAIDPTSGTLLWRREISSSALTSPTFLKTKTESTIFVGSEDGSLYACDPATGVPRWIYTSGHKIVATPVVAPIDNQPLVFIATGFGMVRCLSARTGQEIWQYKTGHEVLSTPAVVEIEGKWLAVIGSADRCVHGILARTGQRAWKLQTGKYVVASPAIAGIRGRIAIFVNSLDNALYGIDALTGCEIMRFEAGDMLWPYETRGLCIWSSPSLARLNGTTSLLVYPAHDGKLYAFTDNRRISRGGTNAVVTESGEPTHTTDTEASRTPAKSVPLVGAILVLLGLALALRPLKQQPAGEPY